MFLQKFKWWVFGFLAIGVGLYPLMYVLSSEKINLLRSKPDLLLESSLWNTGFYAHIVFGGIALMIGWLQFYAPLRKKRPKLHRNLGKIYIITVLISGIASLYIAFFATGGLIPSLGFYGLGIVWLTTTIGAYYYARNKNFVQHEYFMIYSYAGCFGAVTLRIWLPLLTLIIGDFLPAYKIVAWLAWVPNLVVAYFIVNRLTKKRLALAK